MSASDSTPTDPSVSLSNPNIEALLQKLSEQQQQPEYVLGVDFGTNSLVCSLAQLGRATEYPVLVRNATSDLSTDAVLCYAEKERLFGPPAVSHLIMQPQETIDAVKCSLGADSPPAPSVGYLSQPLPDDPSRRCVRVSYRGADKIDLCFEQLAAALLRRLHAFALHDSLLWQAHPAPPSLPNLVVAVPNGSPPSFRSAIVDAARIGGFRIVDLVEEGTAAALCYAVSRRLSPGMEELALFCDVGAAFTNVTLARVTSESLTVLSAKSARLGGRDFDALLFEHFAAEISRRHGIAVGDSKKDAGKLRRSIQQAKTVLATGSTASIELESLQNDVDVSLPLGRALFVEVCAPLLERFKALVRGVAQEAPEGGGAVKVEILGSALILPIIQEALMQATGAAELNRHIDASTSVAVGAGLVGAMGGISRKHAAEDGGAITIKLPPNTNSNSNDSPSSSSSTSSSTSSPSTSSSSTLEQTESQPPDSTDPSADLIVWEGRLPQSEVDALAQRELQFEEEDAKVQHLSNMRNGFEQWIYRTRDQLRAAVAEQSSLQPCEQGVRGFLEEAEEWLLYGEAEELETEALTAAIAGKKGAFAEQFSALHGWMEAKAEEKRRAEQEYAEAMKLQGPRQGRDKIEKPRTTKERIEAAIKRKEQGNSAFTSVDFKTAFLRYGQGIEALKEIQGEMEAEQKEQVDNLLFLFNLNSAACSLKFKNGANKAISFASTALEITGAAHRFGPTSSVKALHRRATAYLQLKQLEEAQKDLATALTLDPQNAPIKQLLTQTENNIQKMEAERKQMYQKMFG